MREIQNQENRNADVGRQNLQTSQPRSGPRLSGAQSIGHQQKSTEKEPDVCAERLDGEFVDIFDSLELEALTEAAVNDARHQP